MSQLDLKIGPKIKAFRRQLGIQANKLAGKLNISPSYLALIEGGKRKIDGDLLLKVCQELKIELSDLTTKDDINLTNNISELLDDKLFEDLDILGPEIKDLVNTNPKIARALIKLGDNFKQKDHELINKVENLSGKMIDSRKTSFPGEVVSDFLQENKNYFDSLEKKAENIRQKIYFEEGHRTIGHSLIQYLFNEHNTKVKVITPEEDGTYIKKYDQNKKILFISEMLNYSSRNFHLAYQIAFFEGEEDINKIINLKKISSQDVISLLKISLLNYLASAILMPYDDFLVTAKRFRYDAELLMHHFATSFEQVTHRLTNLQKPGNEGIPFHFVKTDNAGNVSKRFSLSGIHIPRHGGACPRWNVYSAFSSPGKINTQISRMPDGKVYFCIARAFEKGIEKYGAIKSFVSIGLGCDVRYAKEITYADGIDLQNKKLETPIGISCRICPRTDCEQRAFPPIDRDLKLDIIQRGASPYITI